MRWFKGVISAMVTVGFSCSVCAQHIDEEGSKVDLNASKEVGYARWGIASKLPKETSYLISLNNVPKHIEAFSDSEFGKAFDVLLKQEGDSLKQTLRSEEYKMFKTLMKDEFFFSVGDDGDEFMQTANGATTSLYEAYGEMVAGLLFYGSHNDFERIQTLSMRVMRNFFTHEEFNAKTLKNFDIAPLTVGFKIKNKAEREAIKSSIAAAFEQMHLEETEFVKPYSGKHYGKEFSGAQVELEGMMDSFVENLRPMVDQGFVPFDIKSLEDVAEALKEKRLFITVGEYEDYLIIYTSSSMAGLKFAKSPANSLLANEELAYTKKTTKGDVMAHTYISKSINSQTKGVLEAYLTYGVGALKFFKEEEEIFGDVSKLEEALNKVLETNKKLSGLFEYSRTGMVLTENEGFELKVYGGAQLKGVDYKRANPFLKLPASEDTILSSYWSGSAEMNQYLTTLSNQLMNLGKVTTEALQLGSQNFGENEEFLKNTALVLEFHKPISELTEAIGSIITDGLGDHRAIMIDGGGEFPTLPQVPKPIAQKGKLPRVVVFADVKDHDALGQAWGKTEPAIWNLVDLIGKKKEFDLPMQRVDKIESGGGMWYSYSLPGTHQNCKPSLGIKGDHWMLTTSPEYARELLKETNKTEAANFSMLIQCNALADHFIEWIALMDEKGSQIMGDDESGENNLGNYRKNVRPVLIHFTEGLLGVNTITADAKMVDGDRCITVKLTTQDSLE